MSRHDAALGPESFVHEEPITASFREFIHESERAYQAYHEWKPSLTHC